MKVAGIISALDVLRVFGGNGLPKRATPKRGAKAKPAPKMKAKQARGRHAA
jgi:hypothetical protein